LAIPIDENDIRARGQVRLVDPSDRQFGSPIGWHSTAIQADGEFDTSGNNVRAAKAGITARSYNRGSFEYVYDTSLGPDGTNLNSTIVNTFYVTNAYHDVLYKYGFTEAAGNFQTDNFGKGGRGNDAVIANVQAPGTNNANFATPADGSPGRMNM
jgi:extracellular elastinolytic metalloproteinase